jgi:ABC-2 type transport system permease protein
MSTRTQNAQAAHADTGAAPGYRPDRTLSFGTELRRQLTRQRTRYGIGFLALLPVLLLGAFQLGSPDDGGSGQRGASLVDVATSGGPNFAAFTLFASATFLVVVVVALFCGDTVAGEASWGSLRYLLALPVPRSRLLRQKLLVGAATSVFAVVVLMVVALVGGSLVYGWDPLTTPVGTEVAPWRAVGLLALATGYLLVHLMLVGSLAFLLSVRTDQPLLAVGGAVMLYIVSNILDLVPALESIRFLLPTAYNLAWTGVFSSPVQYEDMAKGAIAALLYTTVFLVLAWRSFARKDVVS